MNTSLQRYVEFRQMMLRQARAQRAQKHTDSRGVVQAARSDAEGAVIERSALLERAAEQAEAMRWTLRAVRQTGATA